MTLAENRLGYSPPSSSKAASRSPPPPHRPGPEPDMPPDDQADPARPPAPSPPRRGPIQACAKLTRRAATAGALEHHARQDEERNGDQRIFRHRIVGCWCPSVPSAAVFEPDGDPDLHRRCRAPPQSAYRSASGMMKSQEQQDVRVDHDRLTTLPARRDQAVVTPPENPQDGWRWRESAARSCRARRDYRDPGDVSPQNHSS